MLTTQKEPLVAIEDITVYKLIYDSNTDNMALSMNQGHKYVLGKKYKTDMCSVDEIVVFDCIAANDQHTLRNHPDMKYIGPGFHNHRTLRKHHHTCIVPKGSSYFLNRTGLIVSNKIIILKPIKK